MVALEEKTTLATDDRKKKNGALRLPVVGEASTDTGSCGSGWGCGSGASELKDAPARIVQLNSANLSAERARPHIEVLPFEGTAKYTQGLMIGLDVGSTTVKAVVIDPTTDEILWKDYQRHDTRQPEKVLEFLEAIESTFPDVPRCTYRLFVTGSGGAGLVRHLGGKFVQEVNAVSLAVEKLYPDVQSVVELGGQDAKIIIVIENKETGK